MRTKVTFWIASLAFSLQCGVAAAEIQTVPFVDVNRYLGDWYQISHVPLWFQGSNDCACARQRLTTTSTQGSVGVLNTCTKEDGSPYSIAGTATVKDTATFAKYSVRFDGVPFEGSYWIIGLDSQYRYAVVTDKDGNSLYILSKTPELSPELYQEAVNIAAAQLSNVSKLIMTRQSGCTYPR